MSNRCCLCGGRIRDGRCVECGMPLQEPTSRVISEYEESKKTRRMTKNSSEKEQKEKSDKPKKEKKKSSADTYSCEYSGTRSAGKALKPKKKKKGCLPRLFSIICVLTALAVPVTELVRSLSDTDSGYEYYDESSSDYDPYEYIDAPLPKQEVAWSTTLEPGIYEVGVQIPAGRYTIYVSEGSGILQLTNDDLGLYVSEYLNEDPEDDDSGKSEVEGMKFYQGSILKIDSHLLIELETETSEAALQEMEMMENPLTDDYNFREDEDLDITTVVAGKDFPAGFYDFSTDEVYSSVSYQVNIDDEDWYYYYSLDNCDRTVHNLLFPEGTEVEIHGHVMLSPSSELGTDWDEDFYEKIIRKDVSDGEQDFR